MILPQPPDERCDSALLDARQRSVDCKVHILVETITQWLARLPRNFLI